MAKIVHFFPKIAKFGVLIPVMIWNTFRYSVNEYWKYLGGFRGVSRYLPKILLLLYHYKVKIVKIKSSSWTKFFTPHERASKTEKYDTFSFPIRPISLEIQSIKNDKNPFRMRSTQNASLNMNFKPP